MVNNLYKKNEKFVGDEIKNIQKLNFHNHLSSNGYFGKKCEKWLVKNIECKHAMVVGSCTAALEMAAILLNIKKNDEIIMPSYTFTSTANAFVMRGGIPVFIDIDKNDLNINPAKIEKAITKKTKAIVIVHYAGVSCNMYEILKIVKKYNLYLIEDAAQAILSSYQDKKLGSLGDLSALSFHESKNIHCGEGGALLINNKKFIKRAKILRDKGTNRDLFLNNLVKKYSWVDLGSSYGLSEIQAAFLFAQFKKAKKIIKKRKILWNNYHAIFKTLENKNILKRQFVPRYAKHNAHFYYVILKKKNRNELIQFLNKRKIEVSFHYIPLHSSQMGKKSSKYIERLFQTNHKSKKIIRFPMNNSITLKKIEKIKKLILLFFSKKYKI